MDILTNYENYLLGRGLAPGTAAIYLGHLRRFFSRVKDTYGEFDPTAVTFPGIGFSLAKTAAT